MAMYIGNDPRVKTFYKPLSLVCNDTCFRYLSRKKELICYVGSSEGATIIPGQSCAWGFTESSSIDRGAPNLEDTLKK
jgi:hypothetical protein